MKSESEDSLPKSWIGFLHLFSLSSIAISQPLFDLLGKNPDFFVARQTDPLEILLLALSLILLIPTLLCLLLKAVQLASESAFQFSLLMCIALLTALVTLQVVNTVFDLNNLQVLGISTAIGITAQYAYRKSSLLRQYVSVLAVGLILFPSVFLFNVLDNGLLSKASTEIVEKPTIVDGNTPIVIVVFDEFALTGIMNAEQNIDSSLFPHLAQLADNAYWFRNASTVATSTLLAIPAILTGRLPREFGLPNHRQYPRNLFTLLADSYDMEVWETATRLCPKTICNQTLKLQPPLSSRLSKLHKDISLIYLHLITPGDLTKHLPPINQSWGDFWPEKKPKKTHMYSGRQSTFGEYIESFKKTDVPRLHFIHINFPHVPYQHMPSGKQYPGGWDIPGADFKRDTWGTDDWEITQAYQRFLLQTANADRLLGLLFERLKALDMYEEALIVITADHGVSFNPGTRRRDPPPITNLDQDILPIPLIIKAPHQNDGVISDRNVETIDILPTLIDILDIQTSWKFDGQSAVDWTLPERTKKTAYYAYKHFKKYETGIVLDSKLKTLAWKNQRFESNSGIPGLFRIGEFKQLLGKRPGDFTYVRDADFTISLEQSSLFSQVDLEASFIPSHIRGQIHAKDSSQHSQSLAIAINGVIQATTLTKEKSNTFSVMVPESAFRDGNNTIEILRITGSGETVTLTAPQDDISGQSPTFSLSMVKPGSPAIIDEHGNAYPLDSTRFKGSVDQVSRSSGSTEIFGWAMDYTNRDAVESVLVIDDNKSIYAGKTLMMRGNAEKNGAPRAITVGFQFTIPDNLFSDQTNPQVRLIAISKDGFAGELIYPKDYPLKGKTTP
jgi:hypothetical protein